MHFIILIIITSLLLFIPLKKTLTLLIFDNDLIFIYLSNMLLLISLYFFFNELFISFYLSLFLMIFSYLLVYHFKNLLGSYQYITFPYFFSCVYTFSNILILYLF